MKLNEIQTALNKHLKAMPNAPKLIIFDNAPDVEIPPDAFALEAVLLPDKQNAADFCLTMERRGIYSVNVFAPLAKGAGGALETAEAVAAHFAYTRLHDLQCTIAEVSRVGKIGGHFVYNVSVEYHA